MIQRLFLPLVFVLTAFSAQASMTVEETTSPGGITAWLVEDHAVPVIALNITFKGGLAADKPGKEGTGYLLASLLDEGAGPYDGPAFQAELKRHGISIDSQPNKDQYSLSMKTTRLKMAKAFDMLRLALQDARLDADAIERMRASILSSIRREQERAGTVAFRHLAKALYADHVYARERKGTTDSVATVTREDLIDWRNRQFARDNMIVTAAGDINAEELGRMLDKTLLGLPASARTPATEKAPGQFDGRVTVIRRDIPQSNIAFALPGLTRDDPDYFAAYLLNHVLGGGSMDSRLGTEIRVKRGLTYGIGSYLITRDQGGIWAGNVATRNEKAQEVIDILKAELTKIGQNGLTAEELEAAKLNVKGAWVMGLRNSSGLANAAMSMSLNNLGRDYPERRQALIDAVTIDDIKRVAKRLFNPEKLTMVIVGNPPFKGDIDKEG